MPGYVTKLRTRFNHKTPKTPVHIPYKAPPKVYGAAAQDVLEDITLPKLNAEGINIIQQVVGVCLYYARAVDSTILTALSTIASQQTEATEDTMKRVIHLLDYLASHPNAVVRYRTSEMILNIHSDASYLSETKSRSRLGGYYFMGSVPKKGEEIRINGSIFVATGILKIVVCSAAEAELGALFLNLKEGKILRLVLEEMRHSHQHLSTVTTAQQ